MLNETCAIDYLYVLFVFIQENNHVNLTCNGKLPSESSVLRATAWLSDSDRTVVGFRVIQSAVTTDDEFVDVNSESSVCVDCTDSTAAKTTLSVVII